MIAESMIQQPDLFNFSFEITTDATPRESAGKRLVSRINKLRRSLPPSEKEFDSYLAGVVREIKTISGLSDAKRQELILFCIEESHAHTIAEIAGDTHLSEPAVKTFVKQLLDDGTLEARQRLTVGGSANQTLIFSKRKPCSCV